jgi:hypothetical protein
VKTGKKDLRQVLRTTKDGHSLVSTGPRLIHESSKSNKVIDTEDTRELSSVLPDGKIVTETQRTTEHEEVKDDELPGDAPEQDFYKESSQRYLKTRDQEDVDYLADGVKIGHEMRFRTETMEVERRGDEDEPDFDSLSARARRRTNNTRQPHRYRGEKSRQQMRQWRDQTRSSRFGKRDLSAGQERRAHQETTGFRPRRGDAKGGDVQVAGTPFRERIKVVEQFRDRR